ncbi:helix-turn-helix domain-containing protein [Dactylosporangium sp. CA-139066]|uniref:helix-turn-helix domain-containing protein n=1 Tax=Dactylosporangium sp. CA-139066 TaxID=3239930 RepID=UPI003D8FEA1D
MQPGDATPNRALARHLRDLRKRHWPELQQITQKQLAEALGGDKPLSTSVISSWENPINPVAPPAHRLAGYARFFASTRSVETDPARLLEDDELTDEEQEAEHRIAAELQRLRHAEAEETAARGGNPISVLSAGGEIELAPGDRIGGGTWYFGPDAKRIVIVTARLPEHLRANMPYAHKSDPDYVRAYTYTDVDSVIELFGHIRAVNPLAEVRIRTDDRLIGDDYHSHLVLLGGIDFNPITRDLIKQLKPRINQQARLTAEDNGWFEVDGKRYEPVVEVDEETGQRTLVEDVAYFFRGPSPMNVKRTVTLCNGMFGRGTYGAVRALTDRQFRNRNEGYVKQRFGATESFSLLFRVNVFAGETVTPDWTVAHTRLHEWPDTP